MFSISRRSCALRSDRSLSDSRESRSDPRMLVRRTQCLREDRPTIPCQQEDRSSRRRQIRSIRSIHSCQCEQRITSASVPGWLRNLQDSTYSGYVNWAEPSLLNALKVSFKMLYTRSCSASFGGTVTSEMGCNRWMILPTVSYILCSTCCFNNRRLPGRLGISVGQ